MTLLYLERREPARNRQRFYAITVTRTLFDGWVLVREWGRIGHPGMVREAWFETEGEAWVAGGVAPAEGETELSGTRMEIRDPLNHVKAVFKKRH